MGVYVLRNGVVLERADCGFVRRTRVDRTREEMDLAPRCMSVWNVNDPRGDGLNFLRIHTPSQQPSAGWCVRIRSSFALVTLGSKDALTGNMGWSWSPLI